MVWLAPLRPKTLLYKANWLTVKGGEANKAFFAGEFAAVRAAKLDTPAGSYASASAKLDGTPAARHGLALALALAGGVHALGDVVGVEHVVARGGSGAPRGGVVRLEAVLGAGERAGLDLVDVLGVLALAEDLGARVQIVHCSSPRAAR